MIDKTIVKNARDVYNKREKEYYLEMIRKTADYAETLETELERLQKKEIPMKPFKTDNNYNCEVCHKWLNIKYKHNYCPSCGQKLDWSDEK